MCGSPTHGDVSSADGDSPLPDDLADDVRRMLDEGLPPGVAGLLSLLERVALLTRANAVASEARFPTDPSGRRHPWPLV